MAREPKLVAEPLVVCGACGYLKYVTAECGTCLTLNEKDANK